MSTEVYTLDQLAFIREKSVQPSQVRLALTAERAIERAEAAERELRACQEQLAARQLERTDAMLVLLHRDGTVEIWSADWRPVRFARVPELPNYEKAVAAAVERLPRCYRELVETDAGKMIAFDSTAGIATAFGWSRIERKLEEIKAVDVVLRACDAAAKELQSTPA